MDHTRVAFSVSFLRCSGTAYRIDCGTVLRHNIGDLVADAAAASCDDSDFTI